jgi:hypothetical protein
MANRKPPLADVRACYSSHKGTAGGGRMITFAIEPEDGGLMANIDGLRDLGYVRLRLDEVPADWVPPALRRRKSLASTMPQGPEELEVLEAQVKRKALQRIKVLAQLARMQPPARQEEGEDPVEVEFAALLRQMTSDG